MHDKQKRQHQAAHDADFHVPEDGAEERQGHECKVDPRLHPILNSLNKITKVNVLTWDLLPVVMYVLWCLC